MRPWPGTISVPSSRDTIGTEGMAVSTSFCKAGDFAMNAAALRDIDDGETRGVEDIAGHDDVGAAEEDNGIAVGMRRRLMEDFNALAVEVHVFPRLIEGFRWPRAAEWEDFAARSRSFWSRPVRRKVSTRRLPGNRRRRRLRRLA